MLITIWFFKLKKLICIFQIWFFLRFKKLICIFIKYNLIFYFIFFKTQNWSLFSLNTNLIFLEKVFFVTKLEILKFKRRDWKLGWSLFLSFFFFLKICDACIINLPHERESSFKKSFFFPKNKSDFSLTN